jgi:hypothetical protein
MEIPAAQNTERCSVLAAGGGQGFAVMIAT